jgi:DNA-binding response OmpR family regulator
MTVTPSCPACVIHDDDAFRRALIATLDQKHFTVSFCADGDEAVQLLEGRSFSVVLVGVNLAEKKGLRALAYLRDHREHAKCGVIILGDPNPELRTYAPWADETLLKPVDPAYVADRARTYCNC